MMFLSTRWRSRIPWFFSPLIVVLLLMPACTSPGALARLVKDNEALQRDRAQLERTVAQRDGTVALLHRRVETLQGFSRERPADLFAPVKLEIASLSGGADYDGVPGDDGVTVYLRPKDADGDVVKVPGRINIQLLDNSALTTPRVLGVCVFDDPETLRKAWYGRFGTQHYALKCPLHLGAALPAARRLTVSAEFVDYLTGATLTAVKEVNVSFRDN